MAYLMSNDLTLRVRNDTAATLTLTIEPWANEYEIRTDTSLDIVETGGDAQEPLELRIESGHMTLFARGRGLVTVYRDGRDVTRA